MKNKINQIIRGISPITKRPFNQADQAIYGWMRNEADLKSKFGHIDAFDYADIAKEFEEYKKANAEIIKKPSNEVEAAGFKVLREADIFNERS